MLNVRNFDKKIILVSILSFFFLYIFCFSAETQSIDEIKSKITTTNQNKAELEKEIEKYQNELKTISKQASTLANTVKTLEATEKKITADIKLTETNIKTTELDIDELGIEIQKQEKSIGKNSTAIATAVREIDELDKTSLVETLLSYESLSEFWNNSEDLYRFQNSLKSKLVQNKEAKTALEADKKKAETKKKDLESLKTELADKKVILQSNKKDQNKLLSDTKNKESTYKTMLSEKQKLNDALDNELAQYESQLKFALDKNTIPKAGSGVLSWPLEKVFITQGFGMTDFAKSGAYNGKAHNGIDFRASIGTKIMSAGSGIVKGTGDTDIVCPGASWGKWVLIEHGNGLSTIYGHMSLVKVTEGQTVFVGDTIGYSGNTGYSTGPHLHLTVYASTGVQVTSLKSSVCKGTYRIPIANPNAYLDPMLYL
jgi:murein DD-endopeptidase MepM/ murein hydrolase activator NlpD